MIERQEIEALIKLLDDPDENIYQQIRTRIVEIGPAVIEDLEIAWESTPDPFFQSRIEDIISIIQQETLKNKLTLWLRKNSDDLVQGATLLSKFQYPDLNSGEIKKQIEDMKQGIWLELQENLTPMEKVNTFNQIFYQEYGFGGNLKNVFNPQNNFIHITLERKKGSPIMLGIIYLAIAQQLRLPIYGVDLPYHFALAFCKYSAVPVKSKELLNSNQVIFYINPISRGIIFSRNEIKDYLKRMKIANDKAYFHPVSNVRSIYALFRHLKSCYVNNNDREKANDLQELIDIFHRESNDLA